MRLSHVGALARMLLVFFTRRILHVGILRSKPMRVLVLGAVALMLVAGGAAAYAFLRPMTGDDRVWGLLFDLATVSVVLWVQIAFLLVRVLFLNAEGMLELSFHLPLTNRERAAAFLLYEATMVAVVSGAGFGSLLCASLLLLGPAAVPGVLQSIVFPLVVTYLALTVVHLALGRLLALLGLRRIGQVVSLLAMFGLLLAYAAQLPALTSDATEPYLTGERRFVWVAFLSSIASELGTFTMVGVFAGVAIALAVLALRLTPNQYVRHSRYVNVPTGRRLGRLVTPYDLCLVRSSQTWLSASMAVAVFVRLLLEPTVNPMWALAILTMGGLYQYAATEPLRVLALVRAPAWRILARLIRAQLVLVAAFWVPALAVVLLVDREAAPRSALAGAGTVAGILLATCIGIVFPAENDNPFSVFVGLSVTVCVLGVVGVALGVLQLPPGVVIAAAGIAIVLLVWYSIQGIELNESRRRHEEITHAGQRNRRSRNSHPGGGRRSAAVSHVHDGRGARA